MKNLILLLLIFTTTEVVSQTTRPANIEIPILVFDNSGYPDSSRLVTCGIDSIATDSIDTPLGEYWLFCGWDHIGDNSDCPPIDRFNAFFDLPTPPPPNTFLGGSYKDIRYGVIPYSGTKTYEIYYQPWLIATEVFISWNFPEGVTGLLQDPLGGVFFNYPMPDSGTFTHPSLTLFSWVFLILTFQNVVPVELVSFNAKVADNNIELNWTTATETNNSGFEIQRLQNSKIEGLKDWEKIGFVPGFGTTTEPKSYSFIDEDVSSGNYKYRLKQIDFDGTFTYSNEIEVAVDFTPIEFVLHQNYPNPFNPTTTVGYQIPELSFVSLKVYDVLGNEIAELVNEEKLGGSYDVQFNGDELTSGIYFYQLQAGSFVQTKKMILTK